LPILEACKGYDLEPEFLSEMGCFTTRIKKKPVSAQVRTTSEVDLGEKGYPPRHPPSGSDRHCYPSPLNFPLLSKNSNGKRTASGIFREKKGWASDRMEGSERKTVASSSLGGGFYG